MAADAFEHPGVYRQQTPGPRRPADAPVVKPSAPRDRQHLLLPNLLVAAAGLLAAHSARAQDPFEIHVYEYEPLTRGEYSLEAHLNYGVQGTALRDGTLLPTDHQTHLTLEPTIGVSPGF